MRKTEGISRVNPVFALLAMLLLASCMGVASGGASDPVVARAQLQEGLALLRARQYPAAKAVLERLRPLQTGDEQALVALAMAADMTGDFAMADKAYAQLLPRSTDRVLLFNNLGYSYMLRGDLEKAAQYITEAARQAPKNQIVKNNLAMLRQVTPL